MWKLFLCSHYWAVLAVHQGIHSATTANLMQIYFDTEFCSRTLPVYLGMSMQLCINGSKRFHNSSIRCRNSLVHMHMFRFFGRIRLNNLLCNPNFCAIFWLTSDINGLWNLRPFLKFFSYRASWSSCNSGSSAVSASLLLYSVLLVKSNCSSSSPRIPAITSDVHHQLYSYYIGIYILSC